MQSKFSVESKVKLCKSSKDWSRNVLCTQKLKQPKSYPPDFPAKFCSIDLPSLHSVDCANSLNYRNFDPDDALAICRGSSSAAPADACANHKSISSLESSQIASLCPSSTVDDSSVRCFKRTPSSFTSQESVRLCAGSRTHHPAECASSIEGRVIRRIGKDGAIELCSGALSNGPATCASAAPAKMESETVLKLCQSAKSNYPAKCFKESGAAMSNSKDAMVSLCKGSDSSAVVECALMAPYTMLPENKAKLCNQATSTIPAECAEFMWASSATVAAGTAEAALLNEDHVVKLCKGVTSVAPALCYFQAPDKLSKQNQEALCEGETNLLVDSKPSAKGAATVSVSAFCAKEGVKQNLDHDLVVALCRSHIGVGTRDLIVAPIECAMAAPFGLSPSELLQLCGGATSGFPSTCAKRIEDSFTNAMKVEVCSNSEDFTPVDCIKKLPSTVTQSDAVALCSEAKTLTPAFCILSLRTSRVTAKDIEVCRNARSVTARLEARTIDYAGDAMLPGTQMSISLSVMDQFGQFRSWDNGTYVSAKLAVQGSQGATLQGGNVNVTDKGLVHFESLSVNQEGNFTLGFYIGQTVGEEEEVRGTSREMKNNGPAASLRLRVGQDPMEARLAGVCHGLFDSFSCLYEDEPSVHVANKLDAVSLIPFPKSRRFLPCIDILEEAGFHVKHEWNGNLWLTSKNGIEMLRTGAGLITKETPMWERLGLEAGASKSQVRKAYFKKSLEWHPDRWVQHPYLRTKAASIFELISEAYTGLTGCIKGAGGSSELC